MLDSTKQIYSELGAVNHHYRGKEIFKELFRSTLGVYSDYDVFDLVRKDNTPSFRLRNSSGIEPYDEMIQ